MKVKIFTYSSPADLEREVNKWLEASGASVQQVVQSQSMEDNQLFISLTIFYVAEEAEKSEKKTRAN